MARSYNLFRSSRVSMSIAASSNDTCLTVNRSSSKRCRPPLSPVRASRSAKQPRGNKTGGPSVPEYAVATISLSAPDQVSTNERTCSAVINGWSASKMMQARAVCWSVRTAWEIEEPIPARCWSFTSRNPRIGSQAATTACQSWPTTIAVLSAQAAKAVSVASRTSAMSLNLANCLVEPNRDADPAANTTANTRLLVASVTIPPF